MKPLEMLGVIMGLVAMVILAKVNPLIAVGVFIGIWANNLGRSRK